MDVVLLGDAVTQLLLFAFEVEHNQSAVDVAQTEHIVEVVGRRDELFTDFNEIAH